MTTPHTAPRSYLKTEELLSALPPELNEKNHEHHLAGLLTKIATKPVPAGSLTRMWLLGSMQAKNRHGLPGICHETQLCQ